MKWKIENRFLANYLLMFFISLMIGVLILILLSFAGDVIAKTLVKNQYPAPSLMKDDYLNIDTAPLVAKGGGVQVINSDYEIVFSQGLNTFQKEKLTPAEFTEFLTESQSFGVPYSYSIAYNDKEQFWLIVSFPTSLRVRLEVVHNKNYPSADKQNVTGVFVAVFLLYLILLAVCTIVYSKISSIGIVNPLKKLIQSARRLRDGDYSARVNLHLKNEFGELEDTFNAMASQIEQEISLRRAAEENRKRLILDISHDLKNPLAGIMGYAEHCLSRPDMTEEDRKASLNIIHEYSVRANRLITDLFELSKMESSEFALKKTRLDICEFIRQEMGTAVTILDQAGFSYEFHIPEEEIFSELDAKQMARVFQNLLANALQYNLPGTRISVELMGQDRQVLITFRDNGIGIPAAIAEQIFQPFVRADEARNSRTGGSGLGLAIVEKIITAHGGRIDLETGENQGCVFTIRLPAADSEGDCEADSGEASQCL